MSVARDNYIVLLVDSFHLHLAIPGGGGFTLENDVSVNKSTDGKMGNGSYSLTIDYKEISSEIYLHLAQATNKDSKELLERSKLEIHRWEHFQD